MLFGRSANQSNIIAVFMLQQHSTVAAWRSISPYPLLVDFTKHLLQALHLVRRRSDASASLPVLRSWRRHSKIWIASSTRSFG